MVPGLAACMRSSAGGRGTRQVCRRSPKRWTGLMQPHRTQKSQSSPDQEARVATESCRYSSCQSLAQQMIKFAQTHWVQTLLSAINAPLASLISSARLWQVISCGLPSENCLMRKISLTPNADPPIPSLCSAPLNIIIPLLFWLCCMIHQCR